MKTIIFVFVLSFLTFGCKKEEPAVQAMTDTTAHPPEPQEHMSLDMLPPHVRAGIEAIDQSKLRSHESAANVYIDLPDSAMPLPIPPPLRPFKDPKWKEGTDSTAVYTFTAANGHAGQMLLVRTIKGNDTVWVPMHILP